MLVNLVLTLILLLPASQAASWRANPGQSVVKIESSFREGSDSKLEGSGFLIAGREENYSTPQWFVLTSEHVVIQSGHLDKYPVEAHTLVTLFDGQKIPAEVLRTDMEHGIALLRLKTAPASLNSIDFSIEKPDLAPELAGQVDAFGVPSGSNDQRKLRATLRGKQAAGSVLVSQEVLVASGAPTEFGMSGGPVFSANGNRFVGLLTHITYEAQPQTFIIPSALILDWFISRDSRKYFSDFARTFEDSQYHFFSHARAERVHLAYSKVAVERRQGLFLVHINTGEDYYYYPGVRDTSDLSPGLNKLLVAMRAKSIKVAELLPGDKRIKTMSLEQVLAVLKGIEAPPFRDFEDARVSASGTVATPSFGVKAGQKLRFRTKKTLVQWEDIPRAGDGPRDQKKVVQKFQGWTEHTVAQDRDGRFITQSTSGSNGGISPGDLSQGSIGSPNDADWWHGVEESCKHWETVHVPAGKFLTCRYENGRSITWLAKLPASSIVKYEEQKDENGNYYLMELEKVTNVP